MDQKQTVKNRNLSELKRDIVLVKLSSGMSVAAIARELDISASHIHDYLRSYDGVQRLETALSDARHILETRLPSLMEKSLNILDATLSASYMSPEKMAAVKLVVQVVAILSTPQKQCPQCESRTVDQQ